MSIYGLRQAHDISSLGEIVDVIFLLIDYIANPSPMLRTLLSRGPLWIGC